MAVRVGGSQVVISVHIGWGEAGLNDVLHILGLIKRCVYTVHLRSYFKIIGTS
jgi:hypothetical protein